MFCIVPYNHSSFLPNQPRFCHSARSLARFETKNSANCPVPRCMTGMFNVDSVCNRPSTTMLIRRPINSRAWQLRWTKINIKMAGSLGHRWLGRSRIGVLTLALDRSFIRRFFLTNFDHCLFDSLSMILAALIVMAVCFDGKI